MTPKGKLIKVKNLMTRVASEEISLASAAVIEISRAGGVNNTDGTKWIKYILVSAPVVDNVAFNTPWSGHMFLWAKNAYNFK